MLVFVIIAFNEFCQRSAIFCFYCYQFGFQAVNMTDSIKNGSIIAMQKQRQLFYAPKCVFELEVDRK